MSHPARAPSHRDGIDGKAIAAGRRQNNIIKSQTRFAEATA